MKNLWTKGVKIVKIYCCSVDLVISLGGGTGRKREIMIIIGNIEERWLH